MNKFYLLLSLFSLGFSNSAYSSMGFEVSFEQYQNGKYIEPYSNEQLTQYRYFFISGFTHESVNGSFLDQKESMKELGFSTANIHLIKTPSNQDYIDNTYFLSQELYKYKNRGSEKWIIVAHSKAALEVFGVMINNPDLLKSHVEALIFIQAPFGGSPLAHVNPESKLPSIIDSRYSLFSRASFFMHNIGIKSFFSPKVSSGISFLKQQRTSMIFSTILSNLDNDTKAQLDKKIHYVRSWKQSKKVSHMLRNSAEYLSSICEKNDGFVCFDDQKLEGIGNDLLRVKADHIDLILQNDESSEPYIFRDSFILSLLDMILI